MLEFLAHVARMGDIHVPAGEWIAGPESPAQIEGLAVKWRGRPRDLDLKYAVRVGGGTSTLMRANGDGSFVGTRGQARPLTEVRFELGGQAAKAHEFVIDALFQGASASECRRPEHLLERAFGPRSLGWSARGAR